MLPFLNNKIGIQASSSEPVKRKSDDPDKVEDTFLSDLKLAAALLGESEHAELSMAKSLINSVIESMQKGKD